MYVKQRIIVTLFRRNTDHWLCHPGGQIIHPFKVQSMGNLDKNYVPNWKSERRIRLSSECYIAVSQCQLM